MLSLIGTSNVLASSSVYTLGFLSYLTTPVQLIIGVALGIIITAVFIKIINA